MSEKEKNVVESITQALDSLPDAKKEYFLGFADGVAAMVEKNKNEEKPAV